MAEISPEDVRLLWTATSSYEQTTRTAAIARENLDSTLLEVARRSKVGLSELAAVTGLHPNTVRAGIQRAAGESTIDFEQPELDLTGVSTPDGLSDELRAMQARQAAANPTSAAAAVGQPQAASSVAAAGVDQEATLELEAGR